VAKAQAAGRYLSIKEKAMSGLSIFITGAAAGYVLSVVTWTKLRQFVLGLEGEIANLKARAAELETKLRFGRGR
jgi:hypothetical protein